MARLLTLTLGPVLITGLVFLTGFRPQGEVATTQSQSASATETGARAAVAVSDRQQRSLVADCQRVREGLMKRLGGGYASIVHTPYVLIGDVRSKELEKQFHRTIAPTQRALSVSYFDTLPNRPIVLLLLSGQDTYESCAELLDGQRRAAFAGYYERGERRIVINLATGDGTIAHELTHALAQFDFPEMPEWFDEGLASLHEESQFSEDGLRIIGHPNWRARYLRPAMQRGNLRSLQQMLEEKRVRAEFQAIDYAHARYFCLFLQQRQLLEPFYRKFRETANNDKTGSKALLALFEAPDLAVIDAQFRAWIAVDR